MGFRTKRDDLDSGLKNEVQAAENKIDKNMQSVTDAAKRLTDMAELFPLEREVRRQAAGKSQLPAHNDKEEVLKMIRAIFDTPEFNVPPLALRSAQSIRSMELTLEESDRILEHWKK